MSPLQFSAPALLLTGIGGGLLAGLLGLGGGVVINPLLMALGLPPRFATASTAAAIVGNSAAATVYNASENRLDWALGGWMGAGAVLGGVCGSLSIARFDNPLLLDQVIRAGFLLILLLAARRLLKKPSADLSGCPSPLVLKGPCRIQCTLAEEELSPLLPFLFTSLISFVGSFLGIGGAVLLTPLLMHLSGAGIRRVIPVIQLAILFGAIASSTGHILFNGNLRPEVALWLVLGGSLGTPLGVWLKRRVTDHLLRILYAVVITLSFLKIAAAFVGIGESTPAVVAGGYGNRPLLLVWLSSVGLALGWGSLSAWFLKRWRSN